MFRYNVIKILGTSIRLKPYNVTRSGFRSSTRLLGRKFILFGLKKVQLGSMALLFSSFLFIISKFYISTIIVKIQLNDNKFKLKFLLKIIWSMQDDDSLLRSFVTIKPAAEKILSDGTAKYRRARTESLEYLSELSFHHARESVTGI